MLWKNLFKLICRVFAQQYFKSPFMAQNWLLAPKIQIFQTLNMTVIHIKFHIKQGFIVTPTTVKISRFPKVFDALGPDSRFGKGLSRQYDLTFLADTLIGLASSRKKHHQSTLNDKHPMKYEIDTMEKCQAFAKCSPKMINPL